LDPVPLDPIVRHVFPDGTRLDSGPDFADRIGAAFGSRAADEWRRMWRRAERVWKASWRDVLTSTVDGRGDLLRLAWHVRELAAGAVTGERLPDRRPGAADLVIAHAAARSVYRELLPTPRRAAGLAERSLAGFVLLLGVRGRTEGLAHHNVFFPPHYDAEFD